VASVEEFAPGKMLTRGYSANEGPVPIPLRRGLPGTARSLARTLRSASLRVRPWLIQPGITGHSATMYPSWPAFNMTGNSIFSERIICRGRSKTWFNSLPIAG